VRVGQEHNVDNGKSLAKERNVASVCAEVVASFLRSVILRPLVEPPWLRNLKITEAGGGQKLWRHLPQIVRVK